MSTGDVECRFFVTGTDAGVDRPEATRALRSLLAKASLHPAAMNPYESGCLDRRPGRCAGLESRGPVQ